MLRCVVTLLVFLSASALLGCGDDTSDGDHTHADAGTAGKGGAAGRGDAGKGGAGAPAPVAGAPATGVKCGSTTCEAPAAAMGFITACCADAATSTCGTSLMGSGCSMPSMGDPRCPSIQAMGLFTIPSCCTPGGMCGIDASMFGFGGCTDLASAAMMSMSMGSGTAIPAPRACDAGDAGAEDAGS